MAGVQAAADRKAIVLLPVGIVEAHGPHMDLSPDFYISGLYCRFLKQELDALGIETVIAPNVYWEDGYKPDYHAGAVETSQVNTFFPEKVRNDIAKSNK